MDTIQLSARAAKALEIMRANGEPMFAEDIAAEDVATFEKGAKSVQPLFINLCKLGLVSKEKASHKVVDKEGKEVEKEHTIYSLTDAGKSVSYTVKV